jgi:hypothetical protein
VKAGPTMRGWPGFSGTAPRIQTFRRPFFRRTVVRVAVETVLRVAIASALRAIGYRFQFGFCQMLWIMPPSTRITDPVR